MREQHPMTGGILVVVGIIAMVMIHETGHFLAARAVGMKATEFFFGFGPRLWSTRRGETEYGVKALPLGGYVRISGMNPLEEVAPEDEGRTYRDKPFWAKSLVVLAGSATHFPLAFLLFYLVVSGVGLPVRTTTVESVQATLDDGSRHSGGGGRPAARGHRDSPWRERPLPSGPTWWMPSPPAPGRRSSSGGARRAKPLAGRSDAGGGGRRRRGRARLPGRSPRHPDRAGRAGGRPGRGRAAPSGDAVVASGRGLWELVTGVPRLVGGGVRGRCR